MPRLAAAASSAISNSAEKASARAAGNHGGEVVVGNDPGLLQSASHIILPGVGAFADCRRGLANLDGMEAALEEQVKGLKKPFLGICVGMQLMAEIGREHKDTPGFGWLPGDVVAMTPSDPALKIPHMGWNDLTIKAPPHPFLDSIEDGSHVYFVHSYVFQAAEASDVLATVDYGGPVTAVIGRDNLVGTQFHPEKSQAVGLRLISNFLNWRP